jgi:N-dimethylarginine dimethylaminohydrolase
MCFNNLSEYYVKPQMLIVHDPTEFGALQEFPLTTDCKELLAEFLFREHPNIKQLHHQHTNFIRTLRQHIKISYLSEILGNSHLPLYKNFLRKSPNLLYTHDAIITIPWIPDGYILGNMKKVIRRDEAVVLSKVADILGLKEIIKIPLHLYLEGGDVIPLCYDNKRIFLMGYGPRTSKETLLFLRDHLILKDKAIDEIIGCKLAEWRLNVDGCFFPVSGNIIVAHLESILDGILLGQNYTERINPVEYFKKLGFTIIEATKEESYFRQACNFVCLDKNKFAAYNITDRVNNLLRLKGIEIIGFEGDQLVKGNGGPHCMTRPIYKKP